MPEVHEGERWTERSAIALQAMSGRIWSNRWCRPRAPVAGTMLLLAVAAALLDAGQECHHPCVMKWSAASWTGDDEELLAVLRSVAWLVLNRS
ncbi:hypothetical protein [Microbispora sp. NPDC049633]|uniref:hypothetical protein n=1 Tax=Microbispora sp. NPDC049633 TaxID=3154355 RepID=UPI00343F3049